MSLTRDWWLPRLTIRSALLLPASFLLGCAVALRRALYHTGILPSQRLAVPVVVIGNLTVGGSGKTPLVIALVNALREHGWRPGVISRGYGRQTNAGAAPLEIHADDDPLHSGDEPLLIARATGVPVFVAADRAGAGRALLIKHPAVNVIISDDGLQHYALVRDVEVAVFDSRGAGNACLLPAGPLREPLSRAAGLTALVANDFGGDVTASSLHQRFPGMHKMQLLPQDCYRLGDRQQTGTLAALAMRTPHTRIAAVAGIGNPARYFATLRGAGLAGLEFDEYMFPDHHRYTRDDLARIAADIVIVTEKDALKCAAFNDDRLWVLPVRAQVDSTLIQSIMEKLRGRQAA